MSDSTIGGDLTRAAATPAVTSTKVQERGQRLTEVKQSTDASFGQMRANLDEAISQINAAMDQRQINASISVDRNLNQFVVKITDSKTGELLRQVPNEAIQRFAMNLEQLKGILFEAVL
jgi:flagellar protein FlaG